MTTSLTQLSLATCGRELARIRRTTTVTTYECMRLPNHNGGHIYWAIVRARDTATVSVGGGVL